MKNAYDILIQKLDKFIRKFYKNQLIKGGIYTLSLLLIFFLLVDILEYFGRFNVLTRTFIFYIYLLVNALIIGKYIVIPLLKLYKFGRIISHEQAAVIIGKHFNNVNDKLLNTLQLKKLSDIVEQDSSLLMAGIDQKIHELEPVPFHSAISFKVNRKYLKYLLIPVIVLLGLLIGAPRVITEPSTRLVNHTTHFEPVLPYQVEVLNEELDVVENEDYSLRVKVTGDELPDKIYVKSGNVQLRFQKIDNFNFVHRFDNVQKSVDFKIVTADYQSEEYTLNVIPKPLILDFSIELDYPGYTGKTDETIYNIGDFVIPEGTNIEWNYHTRNCEMISILLNDSLTELEPIAKDSYRYGTRLKKSVNYSVIAANEFINNKDTLHYTASIIPDQYPVIVSEEHQDSVYISRLFFNGVIKDDYGFSLLTFNVTHKENRIIDTIQISNALTQQQFFHFYELSVADIDPGEQINYFFEVWDNDAINGRKSSRTQIRSFTLPSTDAIEKETEESNALIKEEMEQAVKDTRELQKEIEKLNKKLVDEKELSWKDKEQSKRADETT